MHDPHTLKSPPPDPTLQTSVRRLHRLTVLGRWIVAIGLWLTIAPLSLWGLRDSISLLQQYFTWAAVRHGLARHPISAIGLGLCIGMTVSTLVWQSRNILFGFSNVEQKRLEARVLKIRDQGASHPLWKWIS